MTNKDHCKNCKGSGKQVFHGAFESGVGKCNFCGGSGKLEMPKPKLPTMNIQSADSVISDEMLKYYFEGTNFGCEPTATNQRRLLANGLLKHQAGWYNGHTMQQLIKCNEVVNKKGNINKRGRMFLWEYFSNDNV